MKTTEEIGKITLDYSCYPGKDLYCDGEVEDELLDIVKNYSRTEYPKIIEERKSWPVLYHLSPLRENIVDWIPVEKSAKVLEVGSGCGAITGALSRKAASVTCVDLSRKRSTINAYRHSDCENVSIHVGNFRDIEPGLPEDYDYIFLIGVFEYARGYMEGDEPYRNFLEILRKHLKKGGRIVIAVENRLGMKYFAGCREDHLGTYFSGIENYPDGGGVRTFTRKGLEKIFSSCGIEKYSFYYPYPDYKFMTMIYSDAYLPGKGELCNNIRNFDRDRMLLFDEKSAFDGAVEDGLFPVFSNSYCVVIGEGFDRKYVRYSNDRSREFQIKTEICRDDAGKISVRKLPACEEAGDHIRNIAAAYENLKEKYKGGALSVNRCRLEDDGENPCVYLEYVNGTNLSDLLDRCLEKNDIEGFYALFDQYVERIGYNPEAPVSDFDLIFSNILVDGDQWTLIDYEWTFGKAIDVKESAFRAVYCYLLEDERRNKLNLDLMFGKLGITEEDAEKYREEESNFQKYVTGKRLSMAQLRDLTGGRLLKPLSWLSTEKDAELAKRVQVYEDRGTGYSEENSYFLPEAGQGDGMIECTLRLSGDVKAVRIDPAMDSCAVKILEVTYNGVRLPLVNKKNFLVNGRIAGSGFGSSKTEKNPCVIFATEDPNIHFVLENAERKAENILYVRMKIAFLPMDLAEDLAAAAKKRF